MDFSTPCVKQTSDFFMYLYQDLNRLSENSVDFSTPSVKKISDFFMYLYQDLNKSPPPLMVTGLPLLTPWAHRADILLIMRTFIGCSPVSTGIAPKVPAISPIGTFLLFSMSSQKAPFEPMKDTDLKHLTLKTAFLLALASCKRRSEIHAWVANKVSNQGHWEKVSLFPSSDFIAKNQLAREDSQSVSPVTIPALTTIVDRQSKKTGPCVRCWP